MNEEEKEAIKTIESFKNMKWYSNIFPRGVEILTEEERREIDIVINLIEKQQKEIEFYKIQELGYIQGYEDGKSHKQTAIAIKIENAEQEFIQRKIERYKENYISKEKIKEKIEAITSYAYTSAEERDCQDYAIQVLKELLGENEE